MLSGNREVENKEVVSISSNREDYLIGIMTLEDVLTVFKFDNLLSELDANLEIVRAGKKSIEEYNNYFGAVNSKIKKLSRDYHPDIVRNKGGSEKEISQAEEVQKRINAVREILRNIHENSFRLPDLKYSFFAKIDISLLKDQERLEQINYKILTKLNELAGIKYKYLIPNLNGFLRSSQASMRNFALDNVNDFLKEKNKALSHFSSYLKSYKCLIIKLKLLLQSCQKDNELYLKSVVDKMLNESNMQLSILNKLDKGVKESDLGRKTLIWYHRNKDTQYTYFIDNKKAYEQADKYFVLPFIEYINILFICDEIHLSEQGKRPKKNGVLQKVRNGISVFFVNSKDNVIPINHENKITTKHEFNLLLLHKISHHLVRYYCYNGEEDSKLAAKLLDIKEINRENVRVLFISVVNIYANLLSKEFQPEKDFHEKIMEIQKEFREKIEELFNKFSKIVEYQKQVVEEYEIQYNRLKKSGKEYHATNIELIRVNNELIEKISENEKKEDEERKELLLIISKKDQKIDKMISVNQAVAKKANTILELIAGSSTNKAQGNDINRPSCSKVTSIFSVSEKKVQILV